MNQPNKKLLLHTCCAPCSIACVEKLRADNIKPQLFWFNPNIHPFTEYKSRYESLKEFLSIENLELFPNESISAEEGYDPDIFFNEINPKTEKRCEKCYRIRLEKTAFTAVNNGFSSFSTTLLISPYQDHNLIKCIGEELAEKYKIEFLYRDFRPVFRESQAAARAKNFYMQKYCGCVFSEEEASLQVVRSK